MTEPFGFAEMDTVLRADGGRLYWRVTRGNARAGMPAGRVDKQGYVSLEYRGRSLQGHRVVWLLTHREWPAGWLDHVNGQRTDNRPENLRVASNAENQQNRHRVAGAVPFKGVVLHPCGRFQVTCGRKYVGLFATAQEAARAYDAAALATFGTFARLNFVGAA